MNRTKIFKPVLALLLALITLMGATPSLAQGITVDDTTDASFVYIDGELIPFEDERILNIVTVPEVNQAGATSIAPTNAGAMPNVSSVAGVSGEFTYDPDVYMSGSRVSARRYVVTIDGIRYEAFCADPMLRGPESEGAVYEIAGEANPQLRHVLANGFPINTEWSSEADADERMYWAYVTRVAIAMANYPNREFTGDEVVIAQARALANGTITANHAAYPPIMLNGEVSAQDTGRVIEGTNAQSITFEVTHNRKLNQQHNPFRFEWAAGTPAGTKLVVNGNVVATAPLNSHTVFGANTTSFHLEMPNHPIFQGATAGVNLVGVHSQFADRIWVMQNPNDPDTWQDIVFYIPEIAASASFSFATDGEEPDPEIPVSEPIITSVVIQKIDALTRENIPGALMRLRGISSHQIVTEDGQIWEIDNTGINLSQVLTEGATIGGGDVISTVTDGVWSLEGLPFGAYIVEEERAPDNYSLLPQHTAYGFWLLPPNVSIKVNQDESEAVVDLQSAIDDMLEAAIAAAIAAGQEFPNIPALLQEIRMILWDMLSGITLDVVFDIEEGSTVNSHLITFENYPFGEIEVLKTDAGTGLPLAGAHIRIQGFFAEGNTNGMPIDRVGVTGADGRIVFDNLPAGNYTLSEIYAPPGYIHESGFRSVPLTWGQRNSVTFYNHRKPTLTIHKFDELTNEPLAGATFRIWRTEGETWSEIQITDANGMIVLTDLALGIYSVQEIDEPYGYFRDPERKEILLQGGDNKELTFFNRPRPVLTIFKRDQVTGEPMEGVRFRVQQLEGLTIGEFLTDENGMIELSPRTGYLLNEQVYRITELQPPIEYLIGEMNVRDIMLKWYEPTELIFENLLKPTLIFMKTNGLTGRGISGATYRVEYEAPNGGIINLGSYVTRCGLIVLPYVMPGWYILTETHPAPGFQLPSNPVQRIFLAPGQNSYTFTQTQVNLYVDPRTNPNSGSRGNCGDWCGYLCSRLCAGNCGNPGDGNTAGSTGGSFGNMTITNGNGDPLGSATNPPNNPPTNPGERPTLTAGTVTRNSNLTATITFTSSVAGRYFTSVVAAGANEPVVGTGGVGTACVAGVNTITVYMTSGARDVYIRVRGDNGNVSDTLKISVPAFEEAQTPEPSTEPPQEPTDPPENNGGIIFINPDFPGITITFGNNP